MSGQRRNFAYKKVYHITNRTAEGLPFVPNKYIELLIGGIISRAQEKYEGIIMNAVLFMGNHFHMIITINTDPALLSAFMGYVKGELSGLIHRLTGVSQRSLWATRFKPTALLTPEQVMIRLKYLYLNPVAANLVESINDWEGFSSWQELNGKEERQFRWISDSLIENRLTNSQFTDQSIASLVEGISNVGGGPRPFKCDPFFWKHCFQKSKNKSDNELRSELFTAIEEGENKYREERETDGFPVMGAEKLRYQSIHKAYKSRKYGKTPTCESTCQATAKVFMDTYRAFKEECRKVYEAWKVGRFERMLPPGAFAPPLFPRATILISP